MPASKSKPPSAKTLSADGVAAFAAVLPALKSRTGSADVGVIFEIGILRSIKRRWRLCWRNLHIGRPHSSSGGERAGRRRCARRLHSSLADELPFSFVYRSRAAGADAVVAAFLGFNALPHRHQKINQRHRHQQRRNRRNNAAEAGGNRLKRQKDNQQGDDFAHVKQPGSGQKNRGRRRPRPVAIRA